MTFTLTSIRGFVNPLQKSRMQKNAIRTDAFRTDGMTIDAILPDPADCRP
jgi:hypothetical protein